MAIGRKQYSNYFEKDNIKTEKKTTRRHMTSIIQLGLHGSTSGSGGGVPFTTLHAVQNECEEARLDNERYRKVDDASNSLLQVYRKKPNPNNWDLEEKMTYLKKWVYENLYLGSGHIDEDAAKFWKEVKTEFDGETEQAPVKEALEKLSNELKDKTKTIETDNTRLNAILEGIKDIIPIYGTGTLTFKLGSVTDAVNFINDTVGGRLELKLEIGSLNASFKLEHEKDAVALIFNLNTDESKGYYEEWKTKAFKKSGLVVQMGILHIENIAKAWNGSDSYVIDFADIDPTKLTVEKDRALVERINAFRTRIEELIKKYHFDKNMMDVEGGRDGTVSAHWGNNGTGRNARWNEETGDRTWKGYLSAVDLAGNLDDLSEDAAKDNIRMGFCQSYFPVMVERFQNKTITKTQLTNFTKEKEVDFVGYYQNKPDDKLKKRGDVWDSDADVVEEIIENLPLPPKEIPSSWAIPLAEIDTLIKGYEGYYEQIKNLQKKTGLEDDEAKANKQKIIEIGKNAFDDLIPKGMEIIDKYPPIIEGDVIHANKDKSYNLKGVDLDQLRTLASLDDNRHTQTETKLKNLTGREAKIGRYEAIETSGHQNLCFLHSFAVFLTGTNKSATTTPLAIALRTEFAFSYLRDPERYIGSGKKEEKDSDKSSRFQAIYDKFRINRSDKIDLKTKKIVPGEPAPLTQLGTMMMNTDIFSFSDILRRPILGIYNSFGKDAIMKAWPMEAPPQWNREFANSHTGAHFTAIVQNKDHQMGDIRFIANDFEFKYDRGNNDERSIIYKVDEGELSLDKAVRLFSDVNNEKIKEWDWVGVNEVEIQFTSGKAIGSEEDIEIENDFVENMIMITGDNLVGKILEQPRKILWTLGFEGDGGADKKDSTIWQIDVCEAFNSTKADTDMRIKDKRLILHWDRISINVPLYKLNKD